ncbi:MAG: lysophospholipid acyltransferase family protein [bacterium]|jgi:KDO2-lipid IV(A) lauroyltransferase
MNIKNMLEFAAFRVLVGGSRLLPFRALRAFLMRFFAFIYRIGLLRPRIVETNLSIALGGTATPGQVRKAARKCVAEHGRMAAELIHEERFMNHPGESFRVSGIEHLQDAASRGRGVLILSAHYGNIVLAGYRIAQMGYPLAYVSRPVRNPAVRVELERFYTKYGNTIIPIRSSRNDASGGLKIFKHLRRGGILVVINDQDAGAEGYRSTFFGVPSFIPSGPAHFAFRSGAAVLTAFAGRHGDKVDIDIQAPIDFSNAKDITEAESLILDEYTRRLEAKVAESPELYFWFHKKWKSSPGFRARYKGETP